MVRYKKSSLGLVGRNRTEARNDSTLHPQAMVQAVYDKLEDGTFTGRIPPCKGVIAFRATLRECEEELRSTLEDWILVGIKLGHSLPVIGNIDLNKEPTCDPVGTEG